MTDSKSRCTPLADAAHLDPAVLTKLRQIAGCAEEGAFVEALLQRFLEGTPERLQALQCAAATGDCDKLAFQSHTLKSSSAYVGAKVMTEICQTLESRACAGDACGAAPLVAALIDSFEQIAPALRAMLGESKARTARSLEA